MANQTSDWVGRERCNILLNIEQEVQGFSGLSDQEKATLQWAIDKLLRSYGCRF
jgi:hypothetical protein